MIVRIALSSVLLLSSGCGEEEKGDIQSSCSYDSSSALGNACLQYNDITEKDSDEVEGLCTESSGSYAKTTCSENYTTLHKCAYEEGEKKITSFSEVLSAETCSGTFTEGTVPTSKASCTLETICSEYEASSALLSIFESSCVGTWAAKGCAESFTSQNKCVDSSTTGVTTTTYSSLGADSCSGTFTAAP